jgi:copper chaperone NosL
MTRFFLILIMLLSIVSAQDISPAKYAKLVKKGEKIALKLCDEEKLSKIKAVKLSDILNEIEHSQPCIGLSKTNTEALGYFLLAGDTQNVHLAKESIHVPEQEKCPVCGMFVAKYPKWAALLKVQDKTHYFDGVKDMMKFYIFDGDFPYDRNNITKMEVTDFYTLHAIDAKKAFYVVGSDVFGPMGNELIPFSTMDAAKNFKNDHHGEMIIKFNEITAQEVMSLDGLEYTE